MTTRWPPGWGIEFHAVETLLLLACTPRAEGLRPGSVCSRPSLGLEPAGPKPQPSPRNLISPPEGSRAAGGRAPLTSPPSAGLVAFVLMTVNEVSLVGHSQNNCVWQGKVLSLRDRSLLSSAGYVFTGFGCLHVCNEQGRDPTRTQAGPVLYLGLSTRTSSWYHAGRAENIFLHTCTRLHTYVHNTHMHSYTRAHACTHTHTPQGIIVWPTFNVLIFKFEAPRGFLKRLIQPVYLGAILFISLVTSKNSVFLTDCARVFECFGFWLQLVNFSESVDPGAR